MKIRNLRNIALALASGFIALTGQMSVAHAAESELINQATEFAAASAAAEEAGEDAPEWVGDPDAQWEEISAMDAEVLDALPEDVQQVIYDNVWAPSSGFTAFIVNNLWILLSAALVFLMHLGFATLESGLCQSKNTVNVLFKNCWIIAIGLITYYFWGFNAHYPGDFNGIFAMGSTATMGGLLTQGTDIYADYTWWTDFIFQGMFAATAATIVSGAVAERVKLPGFMLFAVLLVGFAYPWVGSWHWGGGWLAEKLSFYDFAGSTVVHAFGGFAALACVLVLGPRHGKYTKSGTKPILGHSMPLATIGVFLLFLGWFGFNGGSVLNAEPMAVSLVFTTTALAAVGGCIGAIFTGWIVLKKPDLSMTLNGFLAGLVGITAGPDLFSPTGAVLVGLIAGVIVVFSILLFDKIKVDDPVGAISVHGICGIYGTVVCAFGNNSEVTFMNQLIGTLSVCAVGFLFSFIVFFIIKMVMGVRVSEELELEGLDIEEHGSPAYGDMAAQQ